MRIRTDDEVYRVDAVWLGPPRATMPWRARYVAWGVGVVVFLVVLTVERKMGISLFWSIAWGVVVTIILTRLICSRISHERPLSSVTAMWVRELTAPREEVAGTGGAASATRVRVRSERPRPRPRGQRRASRQETGPAGEQRAGGRQAPDQRDRRARKQHGRKQHGRKQQARNDRNSRNRRGGGVRTPTRARA